MSQSTPFQKALLCFQGKMINPEGFDVLTRIISLI